MRVILIVVIEVSTSHLAKCVTIAVTMKLVADEDEL